MEHIAHFLGHSRCLVKVSFKTTWIQIGRQLFALEGSPSFDLEFDLQGQSRLKNGLDFWNQLVELIPDAKFGENRSPSLKLCDVVVANFTDILYSDFQMILRGPFFMTSKLIVD